MTNKKKHMGKASAIVGGVAAVLFGFPDLIWHAAGSLFSITTIAQTIGWESDILTPLMIVFGVILLLKLLYSVYQTSQEEL